MKLLISIARILAVFQTKVMNSDDWFSITDDMAEELVGKNSGLYSICKDRAGNGCQFFARDDFTITKMVISTRRCQDILISIYLACRANIQNVMQVILKLN